MKRNAEYLVCKRDGRREWLRSEKLAGSIELALLETHSGEAWQAAEIAAAVIEGLRRRLNRAEPPADGDRELLTTEWIARAVERVLYATGFVPAAIRYAETRAERLRRDQLLGARAEFSSRLSERDLRSSRLDGAFDRN